VERDRLETRRLPCPARPLHDRGVVEAAVPVSAPNHKLAGGRHLVLDQDVAQGAGDGDSSATGSALRLDVDARVDVPGSFDADDAGREIDVLPAERHHLAAAEARVQRERPEHSVLLWKRSEKFGRAGGRDDAVAASPVCRQPKSRARVDGDVSVLERAAKDDAQRHKCVPDRRRAPFVGQQLIDKTLHVTALNVGQLQRSEFRNDPSLDRG
jgi:hypothetical protein